MCIASKVTLPPQRNRHIMYRSYKKFDRDRYIKDIDNIPFYVSEVFDCIDDAYWFCNELLRNVVEDHAPIKPRIIIHNQVSYMNSALRKAINVRNMLKRKYDRCSTTERWEKYRIQRNLAVKLRKRSKIQYLEKISKGKDTKVFWENVKPLMLNKKTGNDANLSLIENEEVVNEPSVVSNLINQYFISASETIGQPDYIDESTTIEEILQTHTSHESVSFKRDNLCRDDVFNILPVTEYKVYKKLKNLNGKEATGHDMAPPRLVKMAAKQLSRPIVYLVRVSQVSMVPRYAKALSHNSCL